MRKSVVAEGETEGVAELLSALVVVAQGGS